MKPGDSIRSSQTKIFEQLGLGHGDSSQHSKSGSRKNRKRGISSMNRKEKRRLGKQLKKARRIAHCTSQPLSDLYTKVKKARGRKVDFGELIRAENSKESTSSEKKIVQQEKSTKFDSSALDEKSDDDEKSMDNEFDANERKEAMKRSQKIRQMRDLIEEDEMEIRKYSKKLKLHKRKSKSLPKSFNEDGLAYLLDFCNDAKRSEIMENDEDEDELEDMEVSTKNFDAENAAELDEDAPDELPVLSKRPKRQNLTFSSAEASSTVHSEKRVRFELKNDKKIANEKNAKIPLVEKSKENDDGALTEDIYGRLRDKKGNVVQRSIKIADQSSNDVEKVDKTIEMLTKNFRSIINRLSEANIQLSAGKATELYEKYSRTNVKFCLTSAIFNSLIKAEKLPDRLIMEHCLLLAVLHNKLSTEITAYIVEELASKLKIFQENLNVETISTMDKASDNVCLIFCYLFLLKVIHAKLMIDVLKLLSANLNEKTVELVLVILQSVGFNLRKEAPLELKFLIDEINLKASNVDVKISTNESRMKFMLDTLQSVKNNNFLKVANCDLELNDHFLKLLRGFFAGKQLETPLPMTLLDLWSAQANGRWWIVGSAVTVAHRPSTSLNSAASGETVVENFDETMEKNSTPDFNEKLMRLAKNNHMNTELRRNIFCLIVSSEDYLDAFEKLCRLSLKGQQEREIIHIALSCCLKEKTCNPYYSYLVQKFCQDQPRFTLTTQFAIWDKIKLLNDQSESALRNFGLFVGHMLAHKILPLSILKVIDFGTMDRKMRKFCSFLFEKFLCDVSEDDLRKIFSDCLSDRLKDQYESLVDGVKTFLTFALSKDKRLIGSQENFKNVKSKIVALEKFLYYHVGSSLL